MIISDGLFYDGNAMSAAEIQSFLDGKIGSCQTDRCLNVAVVPAASRSTEYSSVTGQLICSAMSGGNLRVSELIYRAQVACGISAKVILVTLQKEQGLVTSRAPGGWALRAAMGMGCPDTAACDDAFAGLGSQIWSGTRQMKIYKAARFARQPGVQYVQYHPNAACGGTTVNVRNYATAALYNYTPYQPNAAALATLTGTGNGCSSYGNRNFWVYYSNWFGSVTGAHGLVSTVNVDHLITRDMNDVLWAYPVKPGGGWGPRASLGAGWGGVVDVVGVGDLDGNSYRDIVARDAEGRAWFYPGSGALSYPTRKQLNVDWSRAEHVLYGGYVDADTNPDMLTVDAAGDLWLWPGDGAGDFKSAVRVGAGFGAYTVVAGVGDFSGDDCGDLLGIAPSGALMLHAGDCEGGFEEPTQIATGFAAYTGIYTTGDFTEDGQADLWAKDAAGSMHLFRGTGGGAITTTSVVDAGWNSMQNIAGAGMEPARPPIITVVTGTDDMYAGYLVARDSNNALWAYPANAGGEWSGHRVSLGVGWAGVRDIVGVGDLDGNGYRDLIARDSVGKSWFYPGDGRLDYPQRRPISADWSSARQILYGGYFDADTAPDVLTVDAAGDLWLWSGDRAGGFAAKAKVAGGFADSIAIAGVGDFDGDRCGDLISITADGQLMLSQGDCVGGLKGATQIGSNLAGYTGIYSTGDFTADRIPDLWLMNSDGAIRLFRGTGGGAITSTDTVDHGWGSFLNLTGSGMRPGAPLPAKPTPTPVPTPTPPAVSVGQTGVGDINGDAKRDILGVSANGHLHAYYGNGDGGIASDKVIDTTWGSPGALQFPMGDFTGDSRPDLGIITGTGEFVIAKGNGSGFDKPVRLATKWDEFDVVLGAIDWDGDGNSDVIARSRTGLLWLYRGDGAGGWASQSGILLATGWSDYRPISIGNFDGDGGDDILALQSNGELWLYRGNGAGGWASLNGTRIGSGWNSFVDVFSPGDFDGKAGPDVLARATDGRLYLYPGTGAGQLATPVQIDSGWQTFRAIL